MMNGEQQLPHGWSLDTVGNITVNFDGKRIPVKASDREKVSGEYPYYGASGIIDHVNEFIFDGNYLLIAEDGANLLSRSTPIAFSAHGKFWVNNHAHIVQTKDLCLSKFLEYYLNSIDLKFYVTGTAQPKLTQNNLNKIPVPIPLLPEQERIVAKIEELFTQLDAGMSALAKVRAGLRRYKASVLKAAVEGKLGIQNDELRMKNEGKLPMGWRWATVGNVAESMKNGIYKAAEFYSDDGIACLRMYNIEEGNIVWKDIKRMILTDEEIETYRLLPGDILVNRVNSRELVGKAAVIPEGIEPTIYESKNIRLKIKKDIADSKFVNYCFGAYRQQYFNYNAQQVVGMASINQTQINQMPIPLPPLEEQRRIVAEVERRLSVAREVESVVEKALVRAARLRQAVLRSAFEGRL